MDTVDKEFISIKQGKFTLLLYASFLAIQCCLTIAFGICQQRCQQKALRQWQGGGHMDLSR